MGSLRSELLAGDRVMKRTAAETIMQTILDSRRDNEEQGSLFNRGTQVQMFEDREQYLLSTVTRRIRAKSKEMSAFDAFNAVQDHVLETAKAHIDRIVLEAFVAGIASCPDGGARHILNQLCDLYALSVIGTTRPGTWGTASCPPNAPRQSPRASTNAAAHCGRSRRPSSTASAFLITAVRRDAASRAHPPIGGKLITPPRWAGSPTDRATTVRHSESTGPPDPIRRARVSRPEKSSDVGGRQMRPGPFFRGWIRATAPKIVMPQAERT